MPNWRHLPVGYHGRAGTVVVSGTPIVRPCGQSKAPADEAPRFGPSRRLDIELELGFVVGVGSTLGEPVPASAFRDHVFGVVLVNDWSARDIQAWEYQPLGPFLGKSFATSIGAWVTPLALLEDRFVPAPAQDPEPLPYLRAEGDWALDVELEVEVGGTVVSRTNARGLYWTMPQQLAHATVNGASVATGDLFASGTISGPEQGSEGSLIELTRNGEHPIGLADGSTRTFLEDDDEVVLRGRAGRARARRGAGDDPARALLGARREASGAVELALERAVRAARRATRLVSIRRSRSMPVSMPSRPRTYTRSSVAMFPVAFGANGQPPSPPTEASSTVAPASSAASAFAYPVLRVLWKWPPTGGPSSATRLVSEPNGARGGDADRVREDEAVRLDLGDRSATSTTRSGSTSPSNGHPNATLSVTEQRRPSPRARAAIRRAATMESSTAAPWLRWLNDSVTPKAKRTSSRPVASSRS